MQVKHVGECLRWDNATATDHSAAVQYGVPLDSRAINVKTDFAMWMSAIYHDNSTLRDTFINGVYDFLTYGESGESKSSF